MARTKISTGSTWEPIVGYSRAVHVDNAVFAAGTTGIAPDGKVATLVQLESPWAPTDVAVFGDIVYVLEFTHDAGDDRTTWMPRIRKITPDGKSAIILTVDQMPGARPAKTAASVSYNVPWVDSLELLLRSIFRMA